MLLEIAYRMVQSLTGKQLLGKVFRGERFLLPSKSWKAAPCCSKYPNLCQLRDSAMGPQLRCVAEPRDSVGIAVPAAWQGTACLVCACPECQGMYSGTGGFHHVGTAHSGSLMGSPGENKMDQSFGQSCLFPHLSTEGVCDVLMPCDEIKDFFPFQCVLNPRAQ